MKKLFIGICLLIISGAANAQFERGKVLLNTSLTGAELSYSKSEKGHLGLEATGGYFIIDDIALTASIGMDLSDDVDKYHFGVGARYYFDENGLFVGGQIRTSTYSYKDTPDDNDFSLCPECGYTFFLSHTLTIEPSAYYNLSLNNGDYNKFGVRVGFSFYF